LDDESDNASEVTRDYLLELDQQGAPLLNVFGGKLTTYRKLAEEAMDRLAHVFPQASKAWTAEGHPLPGGERQDVNTLQRELQSAHPWLPESLAWRLVHSYGSRTMRILGQARSLQDLGEHFGADLYQAEVDYLRALEWAVDATDVLWRRSKLGLRLTPEQMQRLTAYLADAPPRRASFA
jgi:glycerol-3-phosphate dehydrogenase